MKKNKSIITECFRNKGWETFCSKPDVRAGKGISRRLCRRVGDNSSIFLGLTDSYEHRKGFFVGQLADEDGNYIVVGTNGSGKSHFLMKPTLETYSDPMVVLDFKGELKKHYASALMKEEVKRPFIVWGKRGGGTYYEPFAIIRANPSRKIQYIREITFALIAKPTDTKDGYWIDMARIFLTSILIYGFCIGLNFIETIFLAQSRSALELCKLINACEYEDAKMFIRDLGGLKSEHLTTIATEMRRHIVDITTDPDICEALSANEDKEAFSWEQISTDAEAPHVFLQLEQDRVEQWGGIIRLLLTQLIRQLERRPEKHSPKGRYMNPLLLLLDEFPLLGKMDVILNALTTLRSKKVHFYLVIQSISQLDALYGKHGRITIVDNCQYKILLTITEPDSQDYFSRLIGKVPSLQRGLSYSYCEDTKTLTYTQQLQENRESLIWSEEFAFNQDIWLHTPFGFYSTIKLPVSVVKLSPWEIERKFDCYRRMKSAF